MQISVFIRIIVTNLDFLVVFHPDLKKSIIFSDLINQEDACLQITDVAAAECELDYCCEWFFWKTKKEM